MAERLGAPRIGPSQTPDGPLTVNRLLSDVSLGFGKDTPDLQSYGQDAINNMIDNILLTTPGERPFEPEFGSRFPYMLFEPCDKITAYKMEAAIIAALKRWMPYISVIIQRSSVTPIPETATTAVVVVYQSLVGGRLGEYRAKFRHAVGG